MARKTVTEIYRASKGASRNEDRFMRAVQSWCLTHSEKSLAKQVGASPLTIRRIATGTTSPRLRLALRICSVVGFYW